jgi:hypothetical protein
MHVVGRITAARVKWVWHKAEMRYDRTIVFQAVECPEADLRDAMAPAEAMLGLTALSWEEVLEDLEPAELWVELSTSEVAG